MTFLSPSQPPSDIVLNHRAPIEVINFPWQDKCVEKLFTGFRGTKLPAQMLRMNVGYGKTFVVAKLIKALNDANYFTKLTPYKVIYITKGNVVEQTRRVLELFGLLDDCFVTTYDQMRSSLGEMFIKEGTKILHGQPLVTFDWIDVMTAPLVVIDECQSVKNEDSIQANIIRGLSNLPNIQQLYVSASPFTRVSEARAFVVATKMDYKFGYVTSPMCESHWPSFAQEISGRTSPYDYNKEACKRLRELLSPYVVEARGVRPNFHSKQQCKLIEFNSPQDRAIYDRAYTDYLKELAEIRCDEPGGIAAVWVAMLKFRQVAELLRAPYLAREMFTNVANGKAAVCAVNFKATIAKVTQLLVDNYYVNREAISLIWGGVTKMSEMKEEFQDLDIGPQNQRQRQREIDKFQEGKSHYCIFTFKSGGVGLSLHHARVGDRPRSVIIAPTYSAIELVQGIGRAHRITSLSETIQTLIFFKETIEEAVAARVEGKLACLNEIVGSRESWSEILVKDSRKAEEMRNKFKSRIEEECFEVEKEKFDDDLNEGIFIDVNEDI
jgi:hypothetical protein